MSAITLLAIVNVLLCGIVVYLLAERFWRRSACSARPKEEAAAAANPDQASRADWLGALMEKVEGDISRHGFEIDEYADELGAASDDPASVLAVAAAMLVANRRLQSDLAMAQGELQKQHQSFEALSAESRTDPLTGLANRCGFDEELARRCEQWRRHKVPVSLLLVEVDHFREVNDQYGEAIGEAVLRRVANLHRGALRQMDIAARYGSEEFGVILPGTKLVDAANVAERLRATIATRVFREVEEGFTLTVSIGVATTSLGDDPPRLIARTRQALQKARQDGRNRAYLHDGNTSAIQIDESLVRYTFDCLQDAAPYQGGTGVPPASAFRSMRSSDISAKGISFITDSAPDCKAYVVRLGSGQQRKYMVANIANIATMTEDGRTQYRIGCAFVARLEAEGPVDDAISAPLEELVAS